MQSSQLLAADLVVSSSRPIREQVLSLANKFDLQITQTENFRTVAVAKNNTQLVEVKAVETGYPLRGELRVADKLFAQDHETDLLPQSGEAWVEARFLQLADVRVGDTLTLGARTFRIGKVITYEPDRGGQLFSLAPRIMIALPDVASTSLIGPGSRNNYKLLLAEKDRSGLAKINSFIELFNRDKQAWEELLQVSKGRPELRFAFERADYFLSLVSLICIALSALAIAMTATRYSRRHLDTFALMRCMGYTQIKILLVIAIELGWLLLATALVGTALGYMMQFGLSEILGKLLLTELPAPTLTSLYTGVAMAAVALTGFALPPLWLLKKTPPMRVLRRHLSVEANKSVMILSVIATLTLIYLWQLGQDKTTYYLLAGIMVTVAALFTISYLLIKLLGLINNSLAPVFRLGVASITRRSRASAMQVMAFGVGIFVLLFLMILQNDILNKWRESLPVNTPNYFMVNIQKDQISPLQKFYRDNELQELQIYPMVRARLVAINGKPVKASDYDNQRAQNMVNREFNLSWLAKQQAGNSIVDGYWWSEEEFNKPLISLDVGLAKSLKIWTGDELRYDIAGQEFNLKVSSIRAVEWNSFQANFLPLYRPACCRITPQTGLAAPLFLTIKEIFSSS